MSEYVTYIYNGETGEQIVREMTAQEIAELEANRHSTQADLDAAQKLADDKKAAREAALAKLGLTEEEIELFING